MEKKLAGQLGNRIARELAGYLASEAHTNTQGWSSIDPDLRNAIVDTWGGMIADALLRQLPEVASDLNELLKALGDKWGWGPLTDRLLRLWADGDPVRVGVPPTLGPTPDNVVDCGCSGNTEEDLCEWCEGTGVLTRRVRRIKDALAAGMTVVLDKEGAPQAGVTVEGTRSPQDRTADFQESYADVHQVYALLVSGRFEGLRSARFKSRGGAELELTLDPPKDKVEPGRMCSKCSVWMRRDVAEGQVQWTCPTCSVVEVDR